MSYQTHTNTHTYIPTSGIYVDDVCKWTLLLLDALVCLEKVEEEEKLQEFKHSYGLSFLERLKQSKLVWYS